VTVKLTHMRPGLVNRHWKSLPIKNDVSISVIQLKQFHCLLIRRQVLP